MLYILRRLFRASSISRKFEGVTWEDTGQGDFERSLLMHENKNRDKPE